MTRTRFPQVLCLSGMLLCVAMSCTSEKDCVAVDSGDSKGSDTGDSDNADTEDSVTCDTDMTCDDSSDRMTLMYVQEAQAGALADNGDGNYLLTLRNISENTIYFSDRPYTEAGSVPTVRFISEFDWGFEGGAADRPPNAALVLRNPESEAEDTLIVQLSAPTIDFENDTVTYIATPLDEFGDDFTDHRINDHAPNADPSLPSSFGQVSLFIDDCSNVTMYCHEGGRSICVGAVAPDGSCDLPLTTSCCKQWSFWDGCGFRDSCSKNRCIDQCKSLDSRSDGVSSSLGSSPIGAWETNTWMTDLSNRLGSMLLHELKIPGSHDSGSFAECVMPAGSEAAQTSNLNFGDQLKGGIRYMDLRVSYANDIFYLVHNGLTCDEMKFEPQLDKINAFLEANPKEIVVLYFQHLYDGINSNPLDNDWGNHNPMQVESRGILLGLILDKLGEKMIGFDADLTMQNIWDAKKNLVVILDTKDAIPLDPATKDPLTGVDTSVLTPSSKMVSYGGYISAAMSGNLDTGFTCTDVWPSYTVSGKLAALKQGVFHGIVGSKSKQKCLDDGSPGTLTVAPFALWTVDIQDCACMDSVVHSPVNTDFLGWLEDIAQNTTWKKNTNIIEVDWFKCPTETGLIEAIVQLNF